jgi:hypothetical protein
MSVTGQTHNTLYKTGESSERGLRPLSTPLSSQESISINKWFWLERGYRGKVNASVYMQTEAGLISCYLPYVSNIIIVNYFERGFSDDNKLGADTKTG